MGFQKIVNKVDTGYQGGGYNVAIYWDRAYQSSYSGITDRGPYGYYRIRTIGTTGSTGSSINHMYIQDQWRIHPRLTLNLEYAWKRRRFLLSRKRPMHSASGSATRSRQIGCKL